jgi:5-methylcytosine-specific restriction endonuclease McrA
MSAKKKSIRKDFRDAVFKRDGYKCKTCGYKPIGVIEEELDAHHICDRHNMPNGGYVPKNGVSLCKVNKNCHLKAEKQEPGYEPGTLYTMIGSSYEEAVSQSKETL